MYLLQYLLQYLHVARYELVPTCRNELVLFVLYDVRDGCRLTVQVHCSTTTILGLLLVLDPESLSLVDLA